MENKTPAELLQEAEVFIERFGLTAQIQQFLEAEEAKNLIDDTFVGIKHGLQSSNDNVPQHLKERAEKLKNEYLEHESTMRQDVVDNLKRHVYAVLLGIYTMVKDDDETMKDILERTGGVGSEILIQLMQQICNTISREVTVSFVNELYQ